MCECLTNEYGYSLDLVPLSLHGTYDPQSNATIRYETCLSTVTNSQSICYSYYSLDCQPMSTNSTNDNFLPYGRPTSLLKTNSPHSTSSSILRFVSARRSHESSSQNRMRKRESSSSSDNDKRQRSNESLIEEEMPSAKSSLRLRKENCDE